MVFGKHSPSAHVQFYLILQDIFQLVEKLFSYHVENHWVRQDYTTKTSREWEMKELLRFGDFPSSFYHLLSNVIEISVTYRLRHARKARMCECACIHRCRQNHRAQILDAFFFLFWALMPEQTDTPCASPPINRNKSHSASSVSLEKLHHPAGITNWYWMGRWWVDRGNL